MEVRQKLRLWFQMIGIRKWRWFYYNQQNCTILCYTSRSKVASLQRYWWSQNNCIYFPTSNESNELSTKLHILSPDCTALIARVTHRYGRYDDSRYQTNDWVHQQDKLDMFHAGTCFSGLLTRLTFSSLYHFTFVIHLHLMQLCQCRELASCSHNCLAWFIHAL